MKQSLFKQLMVSVLFACSLSADVPDVRVQAKWMADDGRQRADDRGWSAPRLNGRRPAAGLAAHQTGACLPLIPSTWRGADVHLGDGHARGMSAWPAALSNGTTPDPLACALSAVWPLDGPGIRPMDRACIRWDVLPSISPEAMSVQMDPLDAVVYVPRYRMPLVLQASAWPAVADLPTPAEAGFAKAGALRACSSRPVGFCEPAQPFTVAVRLGTDAMIPRLKKIFAEEGVPQRWVWMAEVESALNPQAKSSAGAAGLFQLMPGTARRFGLRTAPVDDRMQPEKSAGAAAQYLKFLRQEFGCWSLALAAYNTGEGRVKEIMKKRNARTFNEVECYLSSETRAYVPKVMAAVALHEDQIQGVPGAYWMP